MKIPKYMKPKDAEALRAEAIGVKGVTYDSRSNRYTADIMIQGRKIRIGSFFTVEEASEAYKARRAAQPVVRPSTYRKDKYGPSVKESYAEFLALNGSPSVNETWTAPDGQVYAFVANKFSVQGRKRRQYYLFASNCRTCGASFETLIPAAASAMAGVARNCEEHRKVHRFKRKALSAEALGVGDMV